MSNEQHPDFEQLIAFELGELDEAGAADLSSSLESSDVLKMRQETVRRLLGTLQDPQTADLPESLARHLTGIIRGTGEPRRLLRTVLLNIIGDTRPEVAVAGFRGGGGPFQLALASPEGEVDLEVAPEPGPADNWCTLRGCVEPTDADGPVEVVAIDADGQQYTTTTEPGAIFELRLVPGLYELAFRLAHSVMIAPSLRIP